MRVDARPVRGTPPRRPPRRPCARGRRSHRRSRRRRRRGRLSSRRRSRDRLHRGLLPTARGRPSLRRDRSHDERPERRLRNGGAPLLALSIAAFPEELPTEMLGDVLAGADERVRAAGAILAGGHTIRDDEPKYGLAVVGTVHPDADLVGRRSAGRRALPDEGTGNRPRPPGGARRERHPVRSTPRSIRCSTEQGGGRCATAFRSLRRDRRHRLRAPRARTRACIAERRARDSRGERALPLSPERSSSLEPASAPAAIAGTASTSRSTWKARPIPPSRRSHTTRRPPAACSCRCPASGPPSSRRPSRPPVSESSDRTPKPARVVLEP